LGDPVQIPWQSLAFYLKPRAGNLMAVAAASGVGKSMFALSWAALLHQPALYVSLDTTLDDQAARWAALDSQRTTDELYSDMEFFRSKVKELERTMPLRFCDSTYSLKQIDHLVVAETEFWGQPPVLTIVDNVADLLEEEESASEYHRVFGGLRKIAKERRTLVVALHHLRRKPPRFGQQEVDQGAKPVMKTDILYGGDREVQYLLGLWRPRNDQLRVSVLKNRMGMADPSSNINVTLRADYSRATLTEDPMSSYLGAIHVDDDRRRRDEEGWLR